MTSDVYTHGHHESVLRSHSWRTAANSAAHLLPHLREGQRLLDVGCGPGTITVDLATHVAPGPVIGVDTSAEVLERARRYAAELGAPVSFQVGDVYALDFLSLIHISEPTRRTPISYAVFCLKKKKKKSK